PKLYLVSFRIHYMCKLAIFIHLHFSYLLYAFFFQFTKQPLQVLYPVVDHVFPARWLEIFSVCLKGTPHISSFFLRVIGMPPFKHGTIFSGFKAQVLCIPLTHPLGIVAFEEYTTYSGYSFWLRHNI